MKNKLNNLRIEFNNHLYQFFIHNIAEVLTSLSEKAGYIQLTEFNSDAFPYHAHQYKSPNEKFTLTLSRSSCNEFSFSGFLCQHLIALHNQEKNSFPIHLVHSRRFKNKDVEKDSFRLNSVHLESNEEGHNDIVINLTNQPDTDPERILRQSTGQVFTQVNNLLRTYGQNLMKQTPDTISQEVKAIQNRIASLRSLPPTCEAMPNLQDLFIQSQTILTVDHADVREHLPGWPRKTNKKKATREYPQHSKSCLICTEIHLMCKYPFYQLHNIFLNRIPSNLKNNKHEIIWKVEEEIRHQFPNFNCRFQYRQIH